MTYPIWQRLTSEELIHLACYQWATYGTKLDILNEPKDTSQYHIESLEEIDKILRQAPSRSRGRKERQL